MDLPPLSSLKAFTLFPHLPLELRLKIWRHCQPGPRVVIFGQYTRYSSIPSAKPSTSTSPLPVTLFINRESRTETLKSYSRFQPFLEPIIAFNPRLDTLLLWYKVWPHFQQYFSILRPYAQPKSVVRSLGIPFSCIEVEFSDLVDWLVSMRCLEELVLWQERNWEDSVERTTVDFGGKFEEWFQLRAESQRLRDCVKYLDESSARFREGKRPLIKFMRVKEGVLGK